MKITEQEVKHIVSLARLTLSGDELQTYRGQLNTIIAHVEQLRGLDTTCIEPTSHVLLITNVTRDDLSTPSLSNEDALKNAPDPVDKFYRVPKIIE